MPAARKHGDLLTIRMFSCRISMGIALNRGKFAVGDVCANATDGHREGNGPAQGGPILGVG